MEKQNNRDILREIRDDLKSCLSDTASMKIDLQVIKSKIDEKQLKEKKKQAQQENDNWWFLNVGR